MRPGAPNELVSVLRRLCEDLLIFPILQNVHHIYVSAGYRTIIQVYHNAILVIVDNFRSNIREFYG